MCPFFTSHLETLSKNLGYLDKIGERDVEASSIPKHANLWVCSPLVVFCFLVYANVLYYIVFVWLVPSIRLFYFCLVSFSDYSLWWNRTFLLLFSKLEFHSPFSHWMLPWCYLRIQDSKDPILCSSCVVIREILILWLSIGLIIIEHALIIMNRLYV